MMKTLWVLLLSVALLGRMDAGESGGRYEVTYEVFSLPIAIAAKLKRENLGGEKSYERLVDGVEEGTVRQEKFMTLKVVARVWALLSEREEFVFPTEYDWGELVLSPEGELRMPGGKILFPKPIPQPVSFAAFDTKNVGDSLECEVGMSQIRLTSVHVERGVMDSFGKGVSEWAFPRFSVQRLKGGSSFSTGKPTLIGTVSPPKNLQIEKEGKRVWLAFVTVKELKKK